ncbi:hypothetical protein HYS84_00880 [Candidatus Saccharibacteria bacterium]|nr:hypothetical protein [Candidatus Saccharibacteria bacterium]
MENTYWLKQTKGSPLFPDLLWSRPENKRLAGKLLIVGGNLHGFAAPAAAYAAAERAGIGLVRVLLPDKLQKTVGRMMPEAQFAPSTPSGSFARPSLAKLLEEAAWADGVLLAGDFGRNSETAILLEKLLDKYKGQVTVAGDGLDYFISTNSPLINRPGTASVINLGKLQKLAKFNRPATPALNSMMLADIVLLLHDWTSGNLGQIIIKHADHFIVASSGQVSTTPAPQESNWQIELAAFASVWWLQNPQKPFEALTSASYESVFS